ASSACAGSRPAPSTALPCASSGTSGPRSWAATSRGWSRARPGCSRRPRPARGCRLPARRCATRPPRSSGRRPRGPRPTTTPPQQALLDLWLGDRDDLCVVGDAAQTIYAFTGATPEYLLGFGVRFPHAQVVRLVRDYRSTPQVVDLANRLLRSAAGRVSAAGV